jgi:ubiquinol-cytochrome c reductase cytochrome b subunit
VIVPRLVAWIDERLGTRSFVKHALRKAFPDHWSFMLGESALYSLIVLILTGTYLAFAFNPSGQAGPYHGPYAPLAGTTVSGAYASALQITFELPGGLLFRQIHHWAAVLFIAAILVHMTRVFLTGAFRRPRELNWMVGFGLLLLALFEGFTGYSLPDDELSGTGLRIGYSIAAAVPIIGKWAAAFLTGGAYGAPQTTGRLYALHCILGPALLLAAIGLHMLILWRQKHTQFRIPGATENNVIGTPLWPNYTIVSLAFGSLIATFLVALGAFVQINPIWQYGPYHPWQIAAPAQPDWYLGWLDGALRIFPPVEIAAGNYRIESAVLAGCVMPALTIGLFLFWPFVERACTGDGKVHNLLDFPADVPKRSAFAVATATFFLVLTLAGSNDIQSIYLHLPLDVLTVFYRVAVFGAPVAAYAITLALLRERSDAESHPRGAAREIVVRAADGGFEEKALER